jgi:plasmid stability protein
MLAFRNMKTLYVRNVPDEVVERLERLAAREGMSVSAFVTRELAATSRRADNPSLLGALPDVGIDVTALVADLDAQRAER